MTGLWCLPEPIFEMIILSFIIIILGKPGPIDIFQFHLLKKERM